MVTQPSGSTVAGEVEGEDPLIVKTADLRWPEELMAPRAVDQDGRRAQQGICSAGKVRKPSRSWHYPGLRKVMIGRRQAAPCFPEPLSSAEVRLSYAESDALAGK